VAGVNNMIPGFGSGSPHINVAKEKQFKIPISTVQEPPLILSSKGAKSYPNIKLDQAAVNQKSLNEAMHMPSKGFVQHYTP